MIEREAFLSTEENFVTMPFFWGKSHSRGIVNQTGVKLGRQ